MGRLHVNTGAIRSTAKDIRSANERIRDEFDSTTKSVFNPLMNSWESPAASHAVKRFTDDQQKQYDYGRNIVLLDMIITLAAE